MTKGLVDQTAAAEHGGGVRLTAGEGLVERHRLLAATLLQEGLLELLRQFEVVRADRGSGEEAEGVLVEDLSPEVAVVAGGVAAGEDMVEARPRVMTRILLIPLMVGERTLQRARMNRSLTLR